MQTQPESTPIFDQEGTAEETSGKKSVIKKVKDKAKKLKTKVKKPKSPGSAGADDNESSSSSSGEEESGSEPQQQVGGDEKLERDLVSNPGVQGEAYEKIPDPHATSGTGETAGVEKQFGQMDLDEKPDALKPQDEPPSAPGANAEERNETIVSKPPTLTERAIGLKDTLAAKLGYGSNKNLIGEDGSGTTPAQVDPQNPENKSVLDKAKDHATAASEAVTSKLGSGEGPDAGTGENKTYTQRAYDAAYGAKDAVAEKLGYGSTDTTGATPEGEQKSYLQGAKEAVASKLGYDNRDQPASADPPTGAAARFHPGDEDRALSQLITEKMSTGAVTVKDTLMRPFGAAKSGSPTSGTSPPPASTTGAAEDSRPVETQ